MKINSDKNSTPKIMKIILENPNDNINHKRDKTGFETEITKKLDKAVKNSTQFCTIYNIKNQT
jgi:hypothetical protein